MKTKSILTLTVCLLVAMMFALSTAAIAADDSAQKAHKQQPTTVTGMVEQGEHGFTITTDKNKTFGLEGEGLEAMVGKKMTVTGMMAKEKKGMKYIKVQSSEEAQ